MIKATHPSEKTLNNSLREVGGATVGESSTPTCSSHFHCPPNKPTAGVKRNLTDAYILFSWCKLIEVIL